MIRSLLVLNSFAVDIVIAKYPREFADPGYSGTVFELVELVKDELVSRNGEIFIDLFINKLVDIKDVAYGDKVDFIVSENV